LRPAIPPPRIRSYSRARSRRRVLLAAATVAVSGLAAASARAQDLPAPAVELHQYHPSPFSDRLFRLDAPGTLPPWRLKIALETDYAEKPLVVTPATPSINSAGQSAYALVRRAVGANLALALGITERIELAALLPVTAFQTGDTPDGVEPATRTG